MKNNTILQILDERLMQDTQWGGPEHDDQHTYFDWRTFIYKQLTNGSMTMNEAEQRRCLIKVAALAVAAVESMDRKSGPPT